MKPCVWSISFEGLCLSFLLAAAVSSSAASLDAIDLGTLGGNRSYATAINNLGQVAGWSDTTTGVRHGFSWTPAGGMVEIGSPNDDGVSPTHVLDSGQVIGTYERFDDFFGIRFTRVFSWTAAGGMVDIGVLPGNFFTRVVAVSRSGQVVGNCCSDVRAEYCRAYSWTSATGMINLGTVGVDSYNRATAVNESGVVVGFTTPSFVGFAWTASQGMVNVGDLALSLVSVNSAGMVAGTTAILGKQRGFVWTASGGMTDVGHLGDGSSQARFISDNGTVAGVSGIGFGLNRAFAWTASGGITNMGALGGFDSGPAGMNKSGLVMGVATGNGGNWQYAFAWTASNGIQALTLGGNSYPRAISEGGHILASGFTSPTGVPRGILWTAAGGITTLLPIPRAPMVGGGNLEVVAVNSRGQVVGVSYPANWEHAVIWQQTPPQPAVTFQYSMTQPGAFEILVEELVPNYPFTVEWSVDFADWNSLGQQIPNGTSKTVSLVPVPNQDSVFYRIRIP